MYASYRFDKIRNLFLLIAQRTYKLDFFLFQVFLVVILTSVQTHMLKEFSDLADKQRDLL